LWNEYFIPADHWTRTSGEILLYWTFIKGMKKSTGRTGVFRRPNPSRVGDPLKQAPFWPKRMIVPNSWIDLKDFPKQKAGYGS
jgi:hypothetical protein